VTGIGPDGITMDIHSEHARQRRKETSQELSGTEVPNEHRQRQLQQTT